MNKIRILPENVLTIPMHLPLGIALTELIAETQIPTIAHHHDGAYMVFNLVGDSIPPVGFTPVCPTSWAFCH